MKKLILGALVAGAFGLKKGFAPALAMNHRAGTQ
jgi:hypothetical protein